MVFANLSPRVFLAIALLSPNKLFIFIFIWYEDNKNPFIGNRGCLYISFPWEKRFEQTHYYDRKNKLVNDHLNRANTKKERSLR